MTATPLAPARPAPPGAASGAGSASLRLFFIVENYHPHAAAGGCYALYKFGEFLARRGHQVRIVGVHDMRWVPPGGNLSLGFRPRMPGRDALSLKADRALARFWERRLLPGDAARFRPDWILGFLTHSAIKAEALGRALGVPVANFVYECPPWMEAVWGAENWRRSLDPWMRDLWERTRRAYLGSRVLLPNSRLSQEYNAQWLGGRRVAEPVHPGVDPAQMPYEEPPGAEGPRLDAGRRHILCVSRMVENKHLGDLLDAFFRMREDADLHLCGSGPLLESLKERAGGSPRVRFHGFLPDRQLWSLYRRCDLVAYPSGFEGFGMPPMQALYFGKPCLASDLPVFRCVFGDALEYFPVRDAGAMAERLDGLLRDPAYRRRRGEEGRRFVLGNFTWERAAERIEEALLASGDPA